MVSTNYKNIDISVLNKVDQRLFLDFLKIHFTFKHLTNIRLRYRKEVEQMLLNYNFDESIKIIDNENKIASYCEYNEHESYNGKIRKEIVKITPKPFVCLEEVLKQRRAYPMRYNSIKLYKKLIKI